MTPEQAAEVVSLLYSIRNILATLAIAYVGLEAYYWAKDE